MLTVWTQHIQDPDEKEKFKRQIDNASPVLDHLINLIRKDEAGLDKSEMDIRSFDSPNWAEKQAFKNGYRSALYTIIKILDQRKETPTNDRTIQPPF